MPISLTVNNVPYQYPTSGDTPGWGGPATDWATQVTFVLNDLQGPTDIVQTTFNIGQHVVSPTDVLGLSFNTGLVRSATIWYSIYRVSASAPYGHSEGGTMNVTYDNSAPTNSKWSLAMGPINGNSGVTFTMTDAGQVQYQSANVAGSGYSGICHFRAKSLGQ